MVAVSTTRKVYAVFGSTGFMDSQKGALLEVFSNEKAAKEYAGKMMGFVEKIEVRAASPW